jgi:hypothetical protein
MIDPTEVLTYYGIRGDGLIMILILLILLAAAILKDQRRRT